jgi:hypothetical protein
VSFAPEPHVRRITGDELIKSKETQQAVAAAGRQGTAVFNFLSESVSPKLSPKVSDAINFDRAALALALALTE